VTTADRFEAVRSDISGALAGLLKQGLKLALLPVGQSAGERMREALPRELRTDVLMGYYNGLRRPLPTPLADEPPDPAPEIAAAMGGSLRRTGTTREDQEQRVQLTLPWRLSRTSMVWKRIWWSQAHRLATRSFFTHGGYLLGHSLQDGVVDALALRWNLAIGSILRVGDSGGPQGTIMRCWLVNWHNGGRRLRSTSSRMAFSDRTSPARRPDSPLARPEARWRWAVPTEPERD